MIIGHACPFPLRAIVPLSWVPPWITFASADRERLWNCRVARPLLIVASLGGTRESSRWQAVRVAPPSPRVTHSADASSEAPAAHACLVLGRRVGVGAVGPDDPAVRALEELVRVVRIQDQGVLVRVDR